MKIEQPLLNNITCLANGAALVSNICDEVLSKSSLKKYSDLDLEKNQIALLAISIFQLELLKKAG